MRRRPTLKSLLLALVVAALWAGPAAAATGPCRGDGGGPICHFWTAKVTKVADGDTIEVHIDGESRHRLHRVRFIGIQAMELSVYSSKYPKRRRGACHAVEATDRLERIIRAGHWRVRLAAQNPASHAGGRLSRSVATRVAGRWQDVGSKLMAAGHTLWLTSKVENAWNERYNELAQEAAQKHIGLWNSTHCGAGPDQHVPLRVWVSWDPLGVDAQNINGEWIKVQNRSSTSSISLAHWWVRDAMLRRFTFPRGTTLAPGATATVHAGHGQASGTTFYWGLDEPPFQNPGDSRHLGDGGYLFDPDGDLRASMVYPCVVDCTNPDQGAIRITPHPRGEEYALFRNVSTHPVDLYGYEMTTPGSSYAFGPDSVLAPNQVMRVDVEGDPADDTRFERHWGVDGRMLPDGGGYVRLATFTDVTLACSAWGYGSC